MRISTLQLILGNALIMVGLAFLFRDGDIGRCLMDVGIGLSLCCMAYLDRKAKHE